MILNLSYMTANNKRWNIELTDTASIKYDYVHRVLSISADDVTHKISPVKHFELNTKA